MAELADEIRAGEESVREAVASSYEKGKAGVQAAVEQLHDGVSAGAEALRSAADKARQQSRAATHAIEDQILTYPLTCLAAAFGIGLIVGKLINYRR